MGWDGWVVPHRNFRGTDMTNRTSENPTFPSAIAAGLVQLAGRDIFVDLDGLSVRGHFWPVHKNGDMPPKGTIVFCPGFTEFCEKYSHAFARLHDAGYDVLVIDWPGQGRSGSLGRNPIAVHIDSFETYLRAMDALITAACIDRRELILMGHSMGGHLALRLTERYAAKARAAKAGAAKIRAAIILSPMIAPPVMPVNGVRVLARLFEWVGLGRSYPPFRGGLTIQIERIFRQRNGLTRWQPGYESQFIWCDDVPEFYRSGPTAGWVRAAYDSCAHTTLNPKWMAARNVPILALTGSDERVVHKKSMDRMIPYLPQVTHHEFVDARHELLSELPSLQDELWQRFDTFIASL